MNERETQPKCGRRFVAQKNCGARRCRPRLCWMRTVKSLEFKLMEPHCKAPEERGKTYFDVEIPLALVFSRGLPDLHLFPGLDADAH